MHKLYTIIASLTLSAQVAFAQGTPSAETTAGVLASSAAIYQSALVRADIAIAKSAITPSVLRGEVGEAIRNQRVANYMHHSGKWLDVSPRLGPQGLDHVSVQLDENGVPYRLMVDETKFGSAQLLRTVRGDIQMGDRYTSERLAGLAKRYKTIAIQARASMTTAKVPTGMSAKRIMTVPLSDTESVRFWRPASGAGPWQYDGPAEAMPKAIQQLDRLTVLHESAANGQISYRRRIFQVKTSGNALTVIIRDATTVDAVGGNLAKLPIIASIPVSPGTASSDYAIVRNNLAGEIRRQMPQLDNNEARYLARGIQQSSQSLEETLSSRTFARYAALESIKMGAYSMLIVLPLETGAALVNGDTPDWFRALGMASLAGGSALAGAALGNTTSYALLNSAYGYSASSRMAELTGLRSAGRFANLTGGVVGGGATGILFAYGGYWLGYYDLHTANRAAAAGLAGASAGTIASAAALGLISTYGVAGTGVAISSLSGVAATNASLAWLGGGALVSGGAGVAGGTLVMATGVGVVVIATTAATIVIFDLWDEHQDNIRLQKLLEYLKEKPSFAVAPIDPDSCPTGAPFVFNCLL